MTNKTRIFLIGISTRAKNGVQRIKVLYEIHVDEVSGIFQLVTYFYCTYVTNWNIPRGLHTKRLWVAGFLSSKFSRVRVYAKIFAKKNRLPNKHTSSVPRYVDNKNQSSLDQARPNSRNQF